MNTIRKRSRAISPSTSASDSASHPPSPSSSSAPASPKHKSIKTTTTDSNKFVCSLKPLCNRNNSIHRDLESLKNHELIYHSFICSLESTTTSNNNKGKGKESEITKCGRVFPNQRYLDLHAKEIHDPSFLLDVQNGEKPYECYLPPSQCLKKFSSPKKRRLHLISKHSFPKEFYFDLTLWGLEGISKKGIAGGLIREVYKGSEVDSREREGIEVERGEKERKEHEDRGTIRFIRDVAPHLALSASCTTTPPLDEFHYISSLPLPVPTSELADTTMMDELTNSFAETKIKLDLVPRAVKLANKLKAKQAMEV